MEVKEEAEEQSGLRVHVLGNGTMLYHSTDMKLDAIKGLSEGSSSLRAPAYFKETPNTQYGKKTLVFKAIGNISLLDLRDLQTISDLYGRLLKEGQQEVADALCSKCAGTVEGGAIVKIGKWKTASGEDSLLAGWLQRHGFDGWLIPFEQPEIMLTSTAGIEFVGRHKW
jgi:hypothetical protein